PAARGKSDQLNVAFAHVRQDIIVITDADSTLEPSCLRRLVEMLAADPNTAIVGARIRPSTRLLEERIHWWLLNRLWWLEGEAFGTAAVSGVCFAIRRSAVHQLPPDCTAEDVHLALRASAAGKRVRICRAALATELRVPQTVSEFLRFRRRRGAGYVRELRRASELSAPPAWRLARAVRLFHFLVMPALTVTVAVMGLALLATAHWQWAVGAAVAFALPTLAVLGASRLLGGERRRWWRLGVAVGRLAGLTWLSLLAPAPPEPPCAQGD
ncbi:MAG: glycosyltransferase, partial [Candidatus Binatia bacterium]